MQEKDWSDLDGYCQSRAIRTKPYITISKSRIITLSAGFLRHAKDQISSNTHAFLSYSRKNNAIVFEFVSNSEFHGAIKISARDSKGVTTNYTNASNASIAGKSFLNNYEIDVEKYSGRHDAKLEAIPDLGERWVVYLDNHERSEV